MEVKRETWTDHGDLELQRVKCSKLGWSEQAANLDVIIFSVSRMRL